MVLVVFLLGCDTRERSETSPKKDANVGILENILHDKRYADAIKNAERDLPGDTWYDLPWHQNVSRTDRESVVAEKMIDSVRGKLKLMSAADLVRSLKVLSRPESMSYTFRGVALDVYQYGNHEILTEIKSRPKAELESLRPLADSSVEVYEGLQGPGDSLADVILHRILGDPYR
jgi:hypothetical protein